MAERRGRERFVSEQPPYSILVRGVENDVLPTCQRYGMGVHPVEPARRRLADRPLPQGPGARRARTARSGIPQRYDMSLPGNQRKLEAADALAQLADEAGLSLIDMALAFVLEHPAVTAPIIGPRTMEQLESQLGAADVTLVRRRPRPHRRDRPAGDEPQPDGWGWQNPALVPAARRRSA